MRAFSRRVEVLSKKIFIFRTFYSNKNKIDKKILMVLFIVYLIEK